jgi:crotonobetainyl-CoA:carnitine CoA-transferase CaiB-like acyl-CoA transferase
LLEGVRVLDLTRAWAGPVAGKFLADLGADVIHVEYSTARAGGVVGPKGYPTEPSPGWSWGELPIPALRGANYPDADPGQDAWNRLGFFNKLHRNKKSLCLDLHATEGFEIFQRLVAVSDVVLDNYSPRGARSLGVIFDLLRELNPRIVVVSITGYGHTGPGSDRVALGPIIEAESGLAAASGYHKGPPMKFGAALPDAISGLNGAIAVLAGLAERDATGEGQFVDLSMLESFVGIGGELVLSTSASGAAPDRRGNRSERYAPQGVYRCAGDDEWVSLTVRTDEQWTALVGLIGAGPLADPRFADEATRRHEQPYLDHVIGAWTAARTKWEATQQLRAVGVVAMPVLSSGDIVHDAQLASRGFMVEWDQPGVGPRLYPGIPLHFEPEFEHEVRPAAPLGRDNREILRDLLGYDDDAITALEQRGVLADRPD